MEIQYFNEYSPALDREMALKVWGHGGRPVLFIPCQNGHCYDFENFGMLDVWRPWIEAGQVTVFAVDTIDQETWSDKGGDPGHRSWMHERWMSFLCDEIAPYIQDMTRRNNGWGGNPGIIAFGCSLGATHAVNLFFRRPDLFDGLLALSGIYTASYGWDDYSAERVYLNSPVDYLAGMPKDHPYISQYNDHRGIIVVGQGPWEVPDTTFRLRDICQEKGIGVWFDIWGYDVRHDWDWWFEQVRYHVPHLLWD